MCCCWIMSTHDLRDQLDGLQPAGRVDGVYPENINRLHCRGLGVRRDERAKKHQLISMHANHVAVGERERRESTISWEDKPMILGQGYVHHPAELRSFSARK